MEPGAETRESRYVHCRRTVQPDKRLYVFENNVQSASETSCSAKILFQVPAVEGGRGGRREVCGQMGQVHKDMYGGQARWSPSFTSSMCNVRASQADASTTPCARLVEMRPSGSHRVVELVSTSCSRPHGRSVVRGALEPGSWSKCKGSSKAEMAWNAHQRWLLFASAKIQRRVWEQVVSRVAGEKKTGSS